MTITVVRQCRYCRCTPESPCRTETGDECAWATPQCDVCTSKGCMIAYDRECKDARRKSTRKVKELLWKVRKNIERGKVEGVKRRLEAAARRSKVNAKERS